MPKTKKYSREPTQADLDAFTGMHCSQRYKTAVDSGWRCPSCKRTARELIRWTEIEGKYWRERFGDEFGMGFTIAMALHHCHGAGRFTPTEICGDCNSADGAAKRKLGLPPEWSFSPEEIGRFVSVAPFSGATKIDFDTALRIFEAAQRK